MVRYYRPDQLAKFSVKPGLTGLAQISGRNILPFHQMIALDLEYVEKRSLGLNLSVLGRTPGPVIRMTGGV